MKASKHVLLTGICMLWLCIRAFSQLCPSNALAPVFTQDFGQGTSMTSTTAAAAGSTNYVYGGVGTDGNYVITPAFDVSGKADWTKLGDHTGNAFGNMFLVNAGGGKSLFFKQTVNGLCSGSTFNFSAWLANANTSSTIGVCGAGYKYPNVVFNIKNTGGTVLATFNTGNLPLSPVNGPANWQQYGFQFTLPAGTSSLVLEMVDFWGGANACGNDLALDDILFTACTPQVTVSLSTATAICSGTSTTISTSLVNSPFTTPAYQWQKSTDNGVTWTNVGTPGTSANDYPLASVSATDGGIYRVLVGPDVASLSSNSCITASNPISLSINSLPSVSISNSSPVCSGNTVTLTATASGGTSPYSYLWSGPNGFSSSSASSSIPTASTAASGTYSIVLTDAKGCVLKLTTTVTVNATPVVAAISGISGTNGGCAGTGFTLNDITTGGTWSSSNPAVATITSGGVVSLVTAGTSVISYSVTSGGCSQAATKTITSASVKLQNDVIDCNNGVMKFDQNPFIPTYSGSLPSDSYSWNMTSTGGTVTYKPGSDPTSQYPYIQLANGFVYSIALQYTTNGIACSDTQIIYKYIIPADTILLSHDTTICNSTNTISLSGSASVITNSFTWSTTGTGSFSTPFSLTTNYTPSAADKAAGNIKIYLTGSSSLATNGSCPTSGPAVDSMILRIVPANTGTNTALTICSKQALNFVPASSVPGSLFSWTSAVSSGTATGNSVSGTGSITDILINPSATLSAVVTYTISPSSLLPNGSACNGTTFTYTVTINPVAVINAITATVCSGVAFTITPTNITHGLVPAATTYSWSAPAVTGALTGGAGATNAATISGTLLNAGNTAQTATYIATPVSGSCTGSTFTINVTVNPVAVINSMTAIVCSGTSFAFTPTDNINGIVPAGTKYTWSVPAVTGGITGGAAATNTTNIAGVLSNPSNISQTATYSVTPVIASCSSMPFTVTVTITPAATITALTAITCSGVAFSVTPTNAVNGVIPAGTLYSWPAPAVTGGITGSQAGSNTAGIAGTLANPSNSTQTATYFVTPVSGSCNGASFTITVTVNAIAVINAITVTACSGVSFSITPTNVTNGIVPAGTVYSWGAPAVTGGLTGGASGTNAAIISGSLQNPSTIAQTATYVITPLTASCSGAVFSVTVTVAPVAVINAMTAVICSGTTFALTPTNIVNGSIPAATKYNWSAPAVTGGITGGTGAAGAISITGSLNNPSNSTQTATYIVTPITGTCSSNTFTVTITVDPVAVVTSLTTTTCSGLAFSITPTNAINGSIPAGTKYNWSVPAVTSGLTGGLSATNAISITGALFNPTNATQTATYVVTPVSGVCNGNPFTVTVSVDPVAVVTAITAITCSGTSFSITPTNAVNGIIPAGSKYSWAAPTVTGSLLGGVTATNALNISGLITNTSSTAQTATYLVTPIAGTCTGGAFTVTITVNAVAAINAITATTCSGLLFALTPLNSINGIIPAGTTYSWPAPAVTGGLTGGSAAANTSNITGLLSNPGNTVQTATYLVAPVSGLCNGASFTVTISVAPLADINAMSVTRCSGIPFTVIPANAINGIVPAGTVYSWAVPAVTGGLTGSVSGTNATSIMGTFTNPANSVQTATYIVTPVTGACGGHSFTVTVTVDPVAAIYAMTAVTCSGAAFTLTPTNIINGIVPAGTIYNWSAPLVSGGLTGAAGATNTTAINGTLTNPTNTTQTATYVVTPVSGACTGNPFTIIVTVNAVANIAAITATTCSGSAFAITPTNILNGIVPTGTTYSWPAPVVTGGLTGGTGITGSTSVSGTLSNPTNTIQAATYSVTPLSGACTGTPFTITISVAAVPAINAMTAITCSGTAFAITPVNIANGSIPAGTTFSWASPVVTGGSSAGAAATASTNIYGTLSNPTNSTQTATYSVTPVSGTCAGNSFTVTISINPVPLINAMTATTCSGIAFAVTPTNIVNGTIPAGTTYSWAVPVVTGGLMGGASATGSTNLPGTLGNPTNSAQTATYSVTPVSGVCAGALFTVTISINPVPVVNAMTATTCSGIAFAVTPTNIVNGTIPAGTFYNWAAPVVTGGLTGGSGATNTASLSASLTNPTNAAQTATYSVTPVSGSCSGAPFTFTVTVDPVAAINPITIITCSGVAFAVTPANIFNGIIPAGTTYSWPAPSVTGGMTGGLSIGTTSSISSTLINPTNASQTATYFITPLSGMCAGSLFTVTVSVNPVVAINAMTATVCSGTSFGLSPVNSINGIIPAGTTYSWPTPVVTGGLSGGSGAANATGISGTLNNPTNTSQTATYVITPLAGACAGTAFTVTVTVDPVVVIHAMTAITGSGISFTVTPTNMVDGIIPAGTTYSWPAPTVTGGMTGGASAVNAPVISGILINPTNITQTATYTVTAASGVCAAASFIVTVTIEPVAVISPITATTCSGAAFIITPTNNINGIVPAGITYSWGVPVVTGGLTGGAGAANATVISGTLNNPTNTSQTATYVVTPLTGAWTGASFTVTITISPVAVINAMTATTCSGTLFSITPTNTVNGIIPVGTTYSWAAPAVTGGLTGGMSAANSISITGTLNNPTSISQTATYLVTPVSGTCTGAVFTVTITVNPVAMINAMTAIACSGATFTVTPTNIIDGSIPAATTYNWSVPAVTGGLTGGTSATGATGITGTLIDPINISQTATYLVTPVSGTCTGTVFTITVSINAVAVINAMTDITCSGILFTITPTGVVNGNIPAATKYSWSVPALTGGLTGALSATNTINISGLLTNPTNATQTATYIVTPLSGACTGGTFTVTVTVNPIATINAISVITCSGASFAITPTDTINGIVPAGTNYSWSTPATTGGLTGAFSYANATVISALLVNTSNSGQTATYIVLPVSGSCTGASFSITVTVNPVAVINAMTIITCSGVPFSSIPVNAVNGIIPAGTTYSWPTPSVTGGMTGGLSAANALAVPGILINTTNTVQTATYVVTPLSNGCNGNAFTVTVTVSPVAVINAITYVTCSGVSFTITPADIINGVIPAGTKYSWPLPAVTGGITGGLSGSNTAGISGTLYDPANASQTATYLLTAMSGACTGSVFTVTVSVDAVAVVNAVTLITCSGVSFSITPTNAVNGIIPAATKYSWSLPAVTGGLTGALSNANAAAIYGSLINTTNTAQTVTYFVTPLSSSCAGNPFTVTVTIDPIAAINTITITTCSGILFAVTPTNAVNGIIPAGTKYSWPLPALAAGLSGGMSAANTTNISGTLINTTNTSQTATYTITPVSGACSSAMFTVTITIDPSAVISTLTVVTCSGASFAVTPTDLVNGIIPAGTTYSWSAPATTGGLAGALSSANAAVISALLINPSSSSQTATYVVFPVSGSCAGGSFTVTVTVNPVAVINAITNVTCSGVSFAITPTDIINGVIPAGTTYSWPAPSVTGGLTGGFSAANALAVPGTLINTTNTVQTATYVVTPLSNGCNGNVFTVTVTVSPVAVINAITYVTCSGVSFTITPTNTVNGVIPAGTKYNWSVPVVTGGITGGLTGSNASDISGTLYDPANASQTATYLLTAISGACTGSVFTVTVSVDAVAAVNALTLITCSGVSFSITPTNAVNGIIPAATKYSWSLPAVTGGLTGVLSNVNAAAIYGNLINATNTTQTATYLVTPLSNSCAGNPFTITVTIDPVADISAITTTTCSGILFAATPTNLVNGIIPAGTKYNWYLPGVTAGLSGGISGVNAANISGTLINTTNTSQTATYIVTPVVGTCSGLPFTVTITIDPSAIISALSVVTCSSVQFSITPTNAVNGIIPAGTKYTWSAPTVSGGLMGGTNAINSTGVSGTLINTTNIPQTATYQVSPVSGACGGTSFSVTVTINPVAVINALTVSTCSGATFAITPTGVIPAATTYSWPTPSVTGSLSGGASATNTTGITAVLNNPSNSSQTATYLITPVSGNCPGSTFTATVSVAPIAMINAITVTTCSGVLLALTPANIINGIVPAGTTYSWPAPSVTGALLNGSAGNNTNNITGSLVNPTNTTQTATYLVTTVSGACAGSLFTVTVTVTPVAAISTMTWITCSGISFNLTPTNVVNGIVPQATTYSWSTPAVTGGLTGGVASTNAVNVSGALIDPVNTAQTATYTVTPLSGLCTGNSFTVIVTIDPVAVISAMTAAICSGAPFTIAPANVVNGVVPAGTLYNWGTPSVTGGLTGAAPATNATVIAGTISNASNVSQTAIYDITAVSGNCANSNFSVTVFIRPLPKAGMNITKSIDCSPFTIDNSIISAIQYPGSNAGYEWYVDNVLSGTGTSFPSFVLTNPSASIKLNVTSLFGCGTDNTQSVIKTYDTPNPSFTLSSNTGCGPLDITVLNTTPDISSYQYTWDAGNGQHNSLVQPGLISYPASALGNDTTYTITLGAFQYCGTFSVSKQITVSRKARLDFTAVLQNACSPLKVLFTNHSEGRQVQYHISYGDGIDSITGTDLQYQHTYYTGTHINYPATLYASNSCGVDSLVIPIAILPNSVKVDLALSDSVVCGNSFALSIYNRTDSAINYKWDFGDGSALQNTASAGDITHTYQSPGVYLITNTITGTCSDTIMYRRFKVYPAVRAVANTITQNNCIGTPMQFRNLSDSGLSIKWIFGDGTVSDSAVASHYFTQAGTYAAKLAAWRTHTDMTCTDTTQQPVTIVATKAGRFTLSDSIGKCLPFIVSFVNQNTTSTQTKWSWGDGQQSSGDTVKHTFTANGDFRINMEARQAGGCIYADSATVHVIAPKILLDYKGGAYCKQNNNIEFTPLTKLTDSIRWNFGDGESIVTTGTQKVSHNYNRKGSFIPKLTLVNNNCAIQVTPEDTIHIDEIDPGFKLTAKNDCAQTNYHFTDTSSSFFPITRRLWTLNQRALTPTGDANANAKEINQVYTKAGDYAAGLEVQNRIGCKATLDAKFNVQVYEFPKANINAINDACLYSLMAIKSVVNSQDSVIKRLWNMGNGTAATDSVVNILYSNAGNYTVTLTVGTVNSCYDSVYKQLSIHPLPALTVTKDKTLCKGDTLQLKATGATSYIWKDQNDNILCNNCTEMKVIPQKSAQYKVIGYNEYGCSNIMSTSIRLVEPFKLGLLASDSMCVGSTRRINANGADNYQWFPTPGLSSYTSGTTYATPAATTTYKVIGKDSYNCFADTASIQLVIGNPTPVNAGKDSTVISGVPIQLNTGNNSPDIRQWQWGGKADYSCVFCQSPVVKVINDEALTVKATNQFGCITTDTVYIKTFCSGAEVFIPNAFTPDGDGINDVLVIQGRGIKVIKNFRIYTRWGELVYEKNNFLPGDKSAGWDGKIRGKLANTDVFVYLCEAICEKGTAYTYKGNVAIIK